VPNPVPFTRSGPDAVKLSMWTVLGAVAASVLTAGILGGASGILQVPGMLTEINALRSSRDQMSLTLTTLSERVRSAELVADALQRQISDGATRQNAIVVRADKEDYDSRNYQVETQKELAALEGRSKDRNTEVKGDVSTIKSTLDGVADRMKATVDAVNLLRQNVYDLASRAYRQPTSTLPPFQPEPNTPSYRSPIPPQDNASRNAITERPLRDADATGNPRTE
jgi:hypothetical protein